MAIFNFQILLLYSSLSIFFCFLFPQTHSLFFNLTKIGSGDQNVNIKIFGNASITDEGLQVTSNSRYSDLTGNAGKATYIDLLYLWDNSTGDLTDFETHFVFVIQSDGAWFADGLTFFLGDPNGSDITPGAAMGLPTDRATFLPTSRFVAVEFDTYNNPPVDPNNTSSATHVGIDVNSIVSNVTAAWYCNVTNVTSVIENEAWIRYDSSSHNLSVVFTRSTNTTRFNDIIHLIVDLRDYLPEKVTFGFTAATGELFETHNVISWDFSSSLQTNETNKNVTNPVVNGTNKNVTDLNLDSSPKKFPLGVLVGIVVGSGVLLVGFVWIGFGLWKRSRANQEEEFEVEMSMENEFESGSGPKKFSYDQLSRATNNFEEEQKLGEGGFGGVYRGFLRELNSYIAVKRISKGSRQGIKEYATEVKIISRLRHRNLVQLIGWCHETKELLLVYEFMENGSLDFHLFKGKSLLTWETRYKIAQGLALALLYLHEEWEQCVVHRDVKSSNVMLDSNFNAKLGDFGLARFVNHEKGPQTTAVAGTMGYLAPECVVTGKASKESDVYSFGVVALEIACGRKPFDLKVPECQMGMVEWVWDLYGMGRLLEAADPKIGPDFDEREMERLMIVGLWCAHPDHNFRPKIRQAIHVLNFEAPLPNLPQQQPTLSFFPPPLNSITTSSSTSQNQHSSSTDNTYSSKFTSSSTASSLTSECPKKLEE